MRIAIPLRRVVARANVIGIIALEHVAKLLCLGIDNPALIAFLAARDEIAFRIVTLNPGDTIVEFEEGTLNEFAVLILNHALLLSQLVFMIQNVASKEPRIVDLDVLF